MASISCRHIYKIYPGNVTAVKDFNLEIADKEFIVFVGPSGCGKSTTLRMIAGLEEISKGEMYIGDRLINDVPPKDRDIAMVFQNYALYPHMTVYDNMAYGLKIRRVPKDEIDRRVKAAAEMLELSHLLDRRPRQLSGGQRQRVAMGRAIVREAAVFLFDEPLSNLDAKLRVQTRLQIQKLHRRLKTTSLYVTHDQVEAMTLAHRMIVMNAGRAEQVGTPKEVYDDPATMFVANFIGSPPMNLLEGELDAEGRVLKAENGETLTLPVAFKALASRHVVLGLRPEHVLLVENDGVGSASVESVEALGADCLVHTTLLGQNAVFRAENNGFIPEVGTCAKLQFDAQHIYWFDPQTTQRIRL